MYTRIIRPPVQRRHVCRLCAILPILTAFYCEPWLHFEAVRPSGFLLTVFVG